MRLTIAAAGVGGSVVEDAGLEADYAQAAADARAATEASLVPRVGAFQLTDWSGDCFTHLWRIPYFPWKVVRTMFPHPARFELAIWVGERLIGLAHCQVKSQDSLLIQAIEGDRDESCPLRGKRALIAIEAANFYAQALGKHILLLHPMNDELATIYVNDHQFKDDRSKDHTNYLWKEVTR